MSLNKNIIIFSTADWDHPFWTNKQYTAKHLADAGHRILYIESLGLRRPTVGRRDLYRIFTRIGRFLHGTKKVHPNIWVYSPLVIPFHGSALVRWLNNKLLVMILKLIQYRLGLQKMVVWTYNPITLDIILALKPEKIIYHNVDDLSAAPGLPTEQINREERRLIAASDLIFNTSYSLYEKTKKLAPQKSFYFPNVADYDHFSKTKTINAIPEDLQRISSPRIGFVGAISNYKLDFQLIATIARRRPDWQWVLIGQVGEGQPLIDIDCLVAQNIHILGPRPHDQLPSYLAGFDVVTLPCPINAYTDSMFPMKFFEYMAAGKIIVSTRLPALRDFENACYFANSVDDFEMTLNKIITGEWKNFPMCEQLARDHTYKKRLAMMLEICYQRL